MSDVEFINVLRDGGGLAIAAYLIWWMTKKLNGKFDRLAESVEKLNENLEVLIRER